VKRAYRWLVRDYEYEHASVRLRFFRVTAWSGELHGREQQAFAWQVPGALSVTPMLPANAPILAALSLPSVYGVSNAEELGVEGFLVRLEAALEGGLRLLQVREKASSSAAVHDLTAKATDLVHRYGARVLVSGDLALARSVGADGVHWPARDLMRAVGRPECELVGASCHDAHELARAAALRLDFVVLGAVAPTPSHPGAQPLGWHAFSQRVADYPLPVYAIGGMRMHDMEAAWRAGAHGIASMRDVWRCAGEAGDGGRKAE
jgi:8-oxo-dGTP diphosphatase